jgi:hypothetical protein
MKKLILIACLFLSAGFTVSGQIIAWNFYGLSQPVSCAATFVNVGISASDGIMTRGPGAAPSAGVHSFRTTGFQNNGISTTNADYFQITLKTEPGFKVSCANINAKFGGTATFYASPGVTSQFAYSVDGVNFTLIGNPVQSTSLTMATVDLSAIPELQDVYYNTTITIRYYASGQTSTGGWGFYSATASTYGFEVDGVVEAALAVPPSIQSSEIAFSNTGQNQTVVSWIPGDGERRIVMINTTNAFTPPANGAYPPANTVYSGSGQQVVYNNSGNTIPRRYRVATGNYLLVQGLRVQWNRQPNPLPHNRSDE